MIAVAVAAAYLIGGLSFGYWIVLWWRGLDVRRLGSGNPGATNVLRVGGAPAGLLVLALDVVKGYAAVELGRALEVSGADLGAVALAAVVGHMFPLSLRFQGGKGVATAAGTLLAVAPWALAAATGVFLAVAAVSRIVSLASMAAAVTVPAARYLVARPDAGNDGDPMIGWLLVISLLVIVRHRANLRRLWAGREPRLGEKVEDPST